MLAGISTDTADAVLAWRADHSVTTEQLLDGGDLKGVHGGTISLLLTSVGDLIITHTCLVIGAGGANLGVDIYERRTVQYSC